MTNESGWTEEDLRNAWQVLVELVAYMNVPELLEELHCTIREQFKSDLHMDDLQYRLYARKIEYLKASIVKRMP